MRKTLAAGAAAEHDNVTAEKRGTGAKLDDRRASQPGAVEQDRLGRQEFERRIGADRQRLPDRRRRAERAVDLFGGRSRHMRACLAIDPDGDVEPVAGDEPARGGDDRRLHRIAGFRRGEQHAQRIALIEMGEPADPVALGKADFGAAVCQYPRARPSLRGSEPPIRTPR